VVALVLSILPVAPGFVRAAVTPGGRVAHPDFFDQLYSYAWFVTFGLSFLIYWLLMRRQMIADNATSTKS
jgi:cytosine/uracil/thiamine/allantoin permease